MANVEFPRCDKETGLDFDSFRITDDNGVSIVVSADLIFDAVAKIIKDKRINEINKVSSEKILGLE